MIVFNVTEDTTEVNIIGSIGEDWFGEGNTLASVKNEVDAITTPHIQVNIDSLGGSVSDGFAIHDLLATHPSKVTAKIIGWTASAGTVIAMGADEVEISENNFFLIHNTWTGVVGNAKELRDTATELDKFDDKLVSIYKGKTGMRKDSLKNLMAQEEWLSAETAKEYGFVDSITKPLKAAASVSNKELMEAGLPQVPERITNQIEIKMEENHEPSTLDKILTGVTNLVTKSDTPEVKEEVVQEATEVVNEVQNEALIKEIAELKAELERSKANPVEVTPEADPEISAELESKPVSDWDKAANKLKNTLSKF
jgi:ATP-dependent Clp protease protease subunit